MPLAARIAISSIFILVSGACIYGWLVQSEYPPSLLGQWAFGFAYLACIVAAAVFALWRKKPGPGFPVKLRDSTPAHDKPLERPGPKQ